MTSSGFIPRLTANLEAGPHLVPELNLTFLINLSSGISGLTCGDTSSGSFVTDREDFVLGVNQVPNLQPILRCDRSTRLLDSLLDSFWELANPVVGEVVSSIPGFLLVFYQLLICLPNLQVALLVTRSSLLLNCGSDRIGYEFRIFWKEFWLSKHTRSGPSRVISEGRNLKSVKIAVFLSNYWLPLLQSNSPCRIQFYHLCLLCGERTLQPTRSATNWEVWDFGSLSVNSGDKYIAGTSSSTNGQRTDYLEFRGEVSD